MRTMGMCVYVLVVLTHSLMFRKKNLNAVGCRPSWGQNAVGMETYTYDIMTNTIHEI